VLWAIQDPDVEVAVLAVAAVGQPRGDY
jgi:hypothetical protein